MSLDKIKQLQLQIETLRRENEQLRKVAGVHTIYAVNGQGATESAMNEPVLSALRTQLDMVKQVFAHLKAAREASTGIERSLETLIPALELQMRGMYTEINQLKDAQSDTAATYADIVEKLENQIKALRQEYDKESGQPPQELVQLKEQNTELSRQLTELEKRAKAYEKQIRKMEKPSAGTEPQDPFTNLSIFDV